MTERSRAAMQAASQVESIVAAAERASVETRRKAEMEAKRIVDEARVTARNELESARRKARDLDEEARKNAAKKLSEARVAADAVLEDAKKLAAALKIASTALNAQAEKLVRDVQLTHRELMSELRLPGVADVTRKRRAEREAAETGRPQPPPEPPAPDELFELPDWVGEG
jgi:cell division septum initiation protein DivIVA